MEPNSQIPEPRIIEERTVPRTIDVPSAPVNHDIEPPKPPKKNRTANVAMLTILFGIFILLPICSTYGVEFFGDELTGTITVYVVICLILAMIFAAKENTHDISKGFVLAVIVPPLIGLGACGLCLGIFAVGGGF